MNQDIWFAIIGNWPSTTLWWHFPPLFMIQSTSTRYMPTSKLSFFTQTTLFSFASYLIPLRTKLNFFLLPRQTNGSFFDRPCWCTDRFRFRQSGSVSVACSRVVHFDTCAGRISRRITGGGVLIFRMGNETMTIPFFIASHSMVPFWHLI